MANEKLYFFKGNENVLTKSVAEESSVQDPIEKIRDSFNKILDGKNISFLLGCGCSSYSIEDEDKKWVEVGIPTMLSLAKEFYKGILPSADSDWLRDTLKLDVSSSKFNGNLEAFLGTLHSIYFFYESTNQKDGTEGKKVQEIIILARDFLIKKCLNEDNSRKDTNGISKDIKLLELYQLFYRKLLYRNSNLPKPNIFTTNYDLYSETALDRLGIHYVNGFSGGIKKYFNPTIFNYALAEKMDLSSAKSSIIENLIYLYKIHGSINWIQDEDSNLFKVREIQETTFEKLSKQDVVMIHPTPLKYNATMGSPYSDLFREFQKKLMQNNNVLITLGYSFSDEHINNLIYQAFTIPSFRLIVLGEPKPKLEIEKLKDLNDPRIWIIGGAMDDGNKLHYFDGFVNKILPDLNNDEIDDKIENALKVLFNRR